MPYDAAILLSGEVHFPQEYCMYFKENGQSMTAKGQVRRCFGSFRGGLIKNLREKAKMTQQELGQRINRDKGIISRYENNYQPVPFETMRVFASIFNVSMDYLAGMEKRNTIDAAMLTAAQTDIIQGLAEAFREINIAKDQNLTAKQFELIGKIVTEFLGNYKK